MQFRSAVISSWIVSLAFSSSFARDRDLDLELRARQADSPPQVLDARRQADAAYEREDGYFDVTPRTTALLNAAWRGAHGAVELLVRRGANVNARDSRGRTPLVQAVRAATDSYWMGRRSPRSVKALLDAGASKDGVRVPTGYDEIDRLLGS